MKIFYIKIPQLFFNQLSPKLYQTMRHKEFLQLPPSF